MITAWLQNNIGTVAIALCVAALFCIAVVKMIKDKKSGKNTCGGCCGSCPSAGICHGEKKKEGEFGDKDGT